MFGADDPPAGEGEQTTTEAFLSRLRKANEGPGVLRAFCLLGGFATVVLTCLNAVDILRLVFDPSAYALNLCLLGLGVLIMAVEVKGFFEPLNHFFLEWCKCLTVPLGKGILYVFTGLFLVSQSFGLLLSPPALIGIYEIIMGSLCLCMHFGSAPRTSS